MCSVFVCFVFFFNDPATTEIYTLSLHDALPIFATGALWWSDEVYRIFGLEPQQFGATRSEEHTSELQSRLHLVCRLLREKKNKRREKKPNNQPTQTARCLQQLSRLR